MVRTANPALLKPMNLSAELEEVVGKGPMSRGQVVFKDGVVTGTPGGGQIVTKAENTEKKRNWHAA